MTETLHGTLAGAPFSLTCDEPTVGAYARSHLEALLTSGGEEPTVTSHLAWHEGQPPVVRAPEVSTFDRVDRDLYVGPDRLLWYRVDDLRDLQLRFSFCQQKLAVEGNFYFRVGNTAWSDRLRRFRESLQGGAALAALRQRRYPTLLSYLVYYPCWWWLEDVCDFHPIHAAGVATDHGVVLLAGASGVGKSTLATALAATGSYRILGDSFVLHRGAEIRPVHEPILLDEWSRDWLGPRQAELIPIAHPYMLKRAGYTLPAQRRASGGTATLLLFPRRAPKSYVRPISADRAHQHLSSGDLIINDLRRYWAFAAVLEQLRPSGLVARREAHLAELTASVPCYEVGLTADLACDRAVRTVLDLLPGAPQLEEREA